MNTSSIFRPVCCFTSASSSSLFSKKISLVFLGSPQVSTTVLDALLHASSASDSLFQISAIVTQPPAPRERGRRVMPSPVAQHALRRGFPSDLIFSPERAGEEMFLSSLKTLQPDVCVTAAYGNILPNKFLNIPRIGTINIHPSILPLYRGAAPVQRALEDGAKETGVSLAFTVQAVDAGPIISYEKMDVDDQIKAPDLLALLFSKGSRLLIQELPSIIDGSARVKAHPQDDSEATLAPKISPDECWLSFDQESLILHNKVRAFAGWPGTRAKVLVVDGSNGQHKRLEIKVITTKIGRENFRAGGDDVTLSNGALAFPCGGNTVLEVLEVQLPGKKVTSAVSFWNGLRGKKLKLCLDTISS